MRIGGLRIEPGEVEAALAKHPAVAENAVVTRTDSRGNTLLVAHIVAADGAPPSTAEFSFTAARGGTEVKLVHSNVPAAQADSYRQGWIDSYWEPLKAYFGARK